MSKYISSENGVESEEIPPYKSEGSAARENQRQPLQLMGPPLQAWQAHYTWPLLLLPET